MMLPRFKYLRPASIEAALELYDQYGGDAHYLSGGTDLVPRVKLRLIKPAVLIDLKGIKALEAIKEEDDRLSMGALARISQLKENSVVKQYFPAFQASLEATSCDTLQMRGTIGGNLLQNSRCLFYNQSEFWRKSKGFCLRMGGATCNAVPGASVCLANYYSDTAPALLTLGAQVRVAGPLGQRQFPLEDLYSGKAESPFRLNPGEILTDIFIPKERTTGGYEKLRLRGAIDYPLLGVALSSVNGKCRFAIGAVGPRPHLFEVESLEEDRIQEMAEAARKGARPAPNTVLDPGYRREMIPILVHRLTKRATEEAR